MTFGYQTHAGFKQSNRKWRVYENEKPVELSKDAPEYKKVHLEFERHTFKCNRCSMFALKKKYSARMMCRNGACIAARYYNAKERWMHENPVAFAQSVVGAVLRQNAKAKYDADEKALDRSNPSIDAPAPTDAQIRPRSADKKFNKKWDSEYQHQAYK